MDHHSVIVENASVAYGGTQALDDVSLRVEGGTTLGVLGHNGAGKTTLVRLLTTLVRPTCGRVIIDGIDAVAEPERARRRIGVTGQHAGLDDYLTARENLEMVGRLVGLRGLAVGRADELIDQFGLGEVAGRRVGELSGGSRRRVDLAASLVGAPSVLFLDEPTTGLDPIARAVLWDVVDELTSSGTTVVLTTQYLGEADRLANRIAVLDHGRIVAEGTSAELKRLVGGKVLHAVIPRHLADALPQRPDTTEHIDAERVRVSLTVADASQATALVGHLAAVAPDVSDLDIASPTLDDVFFQLATTGVRA